MSLGHRPSIGFRCEEISEGNAGKGKLRLSLKGTGTSVCDVKRTHSMLLGHRPSIGFRCEESLEGYAGRGELRLSLTNDYATVGFLILDSKSFH